MWFWGEPRNVQSLVELERWFTKLQKTSGSSNKQFLIETEEGVTIGRIFHENLDAKHRRTEVGMQIGEKEYWGRGYGTDAMITFLDYLFNELSMHRVYLRLQGYNTRALKCYEKCGFTREGTLRHNTFTKGKYYDDWMMSILRDEFAQQIGEDIK
jgi:RimJ/RimL family protein N-acetyltransferase